MGRDAENREIQTSRGDFEEMFKILTGREDLSIQPFFETAKSSTRGYGRKLLSNYVIK